MRSLFMFFCAITILVPYQIAEAGKVTWRCSCTVSPKNGMPFREDFYVSAGAMLGVATAQPRANRSCEDKYGLMRKDDWNPCKCQVKDCAKSD